MGYRHLAGDLMNRDDYVIRVAFKYLGVDYQPGEDVPADFDFQALEKFEGSRKIIHRQSAIGARLLEIVAR